MGKVNPPICLAENKRWDYLNITGYVPGICYDFEEKILASKYMMEII